MDLTYLSIASFILITVLYYAVPSIGKLSVSIKAISSVEEMEIFKQESNTRLAIYLAVVLLTQFIINTTFVINACGGSSISNYGSAFLITFLPWIFMFGIMLIVLIMYPNFKGSFADIVGYFFVSNKANEILSQILMSDAVTQTAINGISDMPIKTDIMRASESITKMLGNKAIIINQITPLNFIDMWNNVLKHLMKPTVFENEVLKTGLLDVAVLRDNIGESMWYIYTGILIISYTSFKITSATCPPDINNLIKKKAHVVKEVATKVANNATTDIKQAIPTVNNAVVKPATADIKQAIPPINNATFKPVFKPVFANNNVVANTDKTSIVGSAVVPPPQPPQPPNIPINPMMVNPKMNEKSVFKKYM
jgi:hypothetical protein